jgi:hypothetical protein
VDINLWLIKVMKREKDGTLLSAINSVAGYDN